MDGSLVKPVPLAELIKSPGLCDIARRVSDRMVIAIAEANASDERAEKRHSRVKLAGRASESRTLAVLLESYEAAFRKTCSCASCAASYVAARLMVAFHIAGMVYTSTGSVATTCRLSTSTAVVIARWTRELILRGHLLPPPPPVPISPDDVEMCSAILGSRKTLAVVDRELMRLAANANGQGEGLNYEEGGIIGRIPMLATSRPTWVKKGAATMRYFLVHSCVFLRHPLILRVLQTDAESLVLGLMRDCCCVTTAATTTSTGALAAEPEGGGHVNEAELHNLIQEYCTEWDVRHDKLTPDMLKLQAALFDWLVRVLCVAAVDRTRLRAAYAGWLAAGEIAPPLHLRDFPTWYEEESDEDDSGSTSSSSSDSAIRGSSVDNTGSAGNSTGSGSSSNPTGAPAPVASDTDGAPKVEATVDASQLIASLKAAKPSAASVSVLRSASTSDVLCSSGAEGRFELLSGGGVWCHDLPPSEFLSVTSAAAKRMPKGAHIAYSMKPEGTFDALVASTAPFEQLLQPSWTSTSGSIVTSSPSTSLVVLYYSLSDGKLDLRRGSAVEGEARRAMDKRFGRLPRDKQEAAKREWLLQRFKAAQAAAVAASAGASAAATYAASAGASVMPGALSSSLPAVPPAGKSPAVSSTPAPVDAPPPTAAALSGNEGVTGSADVATLAIIPAALDDNSVVVTPAVSAPVPTAADESAAAITSPVSAPVLSTIDATAAASETEAEQPPAPAAQDTSSSAPSSPSLPPQFPSSSSPLHQPTSAVAAPDDVCGSEFCSCVDGGSDATGGGSGVPVPSDAGSSGVGSSADVSGSGGHVIGGSDVSDGSSSGAAVEPGPAAACEVKNTPVAEVACAASDAGAAASDAGAAASDAGAAASDAGAAVSDHTSTSLGASYGSESNEPGAAAAANCDSVALSILSAVVELPVPTSSTEPPTAAAAAAAAAPTGPPHTYNGAADAASPVEGQIAAASADESGGCRVKETALSATPDAVEEATAPVEETVECSADSHAGSELPADSGTAPAAAAVSPDHAGIDGCQASAANAPAEVGALASDTGLLMLASPPLQTDPAFAAADVTVVADVTTATGGDAFPLNSDDVPLNSNNDEAFSVDKPVAAVNPYEAALAAPFALACGAVTAEYDQHDQPIASPPYSDFYSGDAVSSSASGVISGTGSSGNNPYAALLPSLPSTRHMSSSAADDDDSRKASSSDDATYSGGQTVTRLSPFAAVFDPPPSAPPSNPSSPSLSVLLAEAAASEDIMSLSDIA